MTPRLAALSIALYAAGISAFASLPFPDATSLRTCFITSFIVFFRRRLKTCLLSDARYAFFAPLVIAIYWSQLYVIEQKSATARYRPLKLLPNSHWIGHKSVTVVAYDYEDKR